MLLGVFAFDAVFPYLPEWGIRSYPQSMTLPVLLDVSYGALAVTLGVLLLLGVAFAEVFDPGKRLDPPAAQRASLLKREWGFASAGVLAGLLLLAAPLQGQYLGISGGVAALTAYLAKPFGLSMNSVAMFDDTTAWRAAMVVGLFPGAAASALLSGSFGSAAVTPLWAAAFPSGLKSRAVAAFAGGFLIMLGALVGGGCTTGQFMSGFPTLSVGSFAMGMTFFAVGMATAHLLYWGRWRKLAEVRGRALDLATD